MFPIVESPEEEAWEFTKSRLVTWANREVTVYDPTRGSPTKADGPPKAQELKDMLVGPDQRLTLHKVPLISQTCFSAVRLSRRLHHPRR